MIAMNDEIHTSEYTSRKSKKQIKAQQKQNTWQKATQ